MFYLMDFQSPQRNMQFICLQCEMRELYFFSILSYIANIKSVCQRQINKFTLAHTENNTRIPLCYHFDYIGSFNLIFGTNRRNTSHYSTCNRQTNTYWCTSAQFECNNITFLRPSNQAPTICIWSSIICWHDVDHLYTYFHMDHIAIDAFDNHEGGRAMFNFLVVFD